MNNNIKGLPQNPIIDRLPSALDGTAIGDCYRAHPSYPTHLLPWYIQRNETIFARFAYRTDALLLAQIRANKSEKIGQIISDRTAIVPLPWCLAQNERIVARFLLRNDCVALLKKRAELLGSFAHFLYWEDK